MRCARGRRRHAHRITAGPRPPVAGLRALSRELQRHVEVGGFHDPEAGQVLLRLEERPVGEHRHAAAVVDDGGRGRATARPAGEDPVALGDEAVVEHVDRRHLGIGGEVGAVVEHGNQVLHLGPSPVESGRPGSGRSPLLRTPLPRSDTVVPNNFPDGRRRRTRPTRAVRRTVLPSWVGGHQGSTAALPAGGSGGSALEARRAVGVRHPATARADRDESARPGQTRRQHRGGVPGSGLRPSVRRAVALAGRGLGDQLRHVGDGRGIAPGHRRAVPPGRGRIPTRPSRRCRWTHSAAFRGGRRSATRSPST